MHTIEHTDLDGDALTIHRDKGLAWVTVTRDERELTVGPVPADVLEPLGSYVRHEKHDVECHDCIRDAAVIREPRPLSPDAISADAYERGVPRLRAALGYDMSPLMAHEVVKDIVTAVLTEPPARPEGAEEIEFLIADRLGGDVPGDVIRALADETAERAGATRLYPEDGAA